MKQRLEAILLGMLRPINPYVTGILGTFTLFWGLWVVNPFWTVFTQAAIYDKMNGFAPEWAWGTWSTLAGAYMLAELYRGKYRQLLWSLAFTLWHWATMAGMFFWGDWQNTAGLAYSFIAFYALYAYLNIKINYVTKGTSKTF